MLSLVVTHGRDQPFQVPATEAREWEDALRFGLQRIEAPYYADIAFSFAFYGDVWRPDSGGDAGEREFASRPEETRELQIELARELAAAAGIPIAEERSEGARDFWDSLATIINTLDSRFGVGQVVFKCFLGDLAQYLSNKRLRNQVLGRVEQTIRAANGPVALLGHSMGSIVSYDLMVQRPDLPVQALVTFGSPLGMATCRKYLARLNGGTPFPARLPRWINVYNRQDIATLVHLLAPLFVSGDARSVEDREMVGKPPNITEPVTGHDPIVYLSSWAMGEAIRAIVDEWLATHSV